MGKSGKSFYVYTLEDGEATGFDPVPLNEEIGDRYDLVQNGKYRNLKSKLAAPKFVQKENQIKQAQERKEKSINQTMDRKEASIILSSAQRDATLLTTTFYPGLTQAEWRAKWKENVTWLLENRPTDEDLETAEINKIIK